MEIPENVKRFCETVRIPVFDKAWHESQNRIDYYRYKKETKEFLIKNLLFKFIEYNYKLFYVRGFGMFDSILNVNCPFEDEEAFNSDKILSCFTVYGYEVSILNDEIEKISENSMLTIPFPAIENITIIKQYQFIDAIKASVDKMINRSEQNIKIYYGF
jgi:hypothetical protein